MIRLRGCDTMNLDKLLNPKQKEAATYLDSHLRIIAGAGSGKTRVLTYRIAYLIEEVGLSLDIYWLLLLQIKQRMKCVKELWIY